MAAHRREFVSDEFRTPKSLYTDPRVVDWPFQIHGVVKIRDQELSIPPLDARSHPTIEFLRTSYYIEGL
jgi:hypothetical protein